MARDGMIGVRVSPEERALIEAAASASGLDLSGFVRNAVLSAARGKDITCYGDVIGYIEELAGRATAEIAPFYEPDHGLLEDKLTVLGEREGNLRADLAGIEENIADAQAKFEAALGDADPTEAEEIQLQLDRLRRRRELLREALESVKRQQADVERRIRERDEAIAERHRELIQQEVLSLLLQEGDNKLARLLASWFDCLTLVLNEGGVPEPLRRRLLPLKGVTAVLRLTAKHLLARAAELARHPEVAQAFAWDERQPFSWRHRGMTASELFNVASSSG